MRAGSQQLVRGFVVVLLAALAVSCIPAIPPPEVTRPEGGSDLEVTASAASATVFEGSPATVSAVASGGALPYSYRWDQNAGPEDLTLVDVTARPPPRVSRRCHTVFVPAKDKPFEATCSSNFFR